MSNMAEIISQGNLNETMFTAVYEWSPSKIIEILLSILNTFLVTPWLMYIIWYERYGDNHRRTLINQLLASHFYYAVFYSIFGQSLDVAITAVGPCGSLLCYLQQYIRGVVTFQLIQLFTSIFTVKYFYIFVLKNPAGVHEEFWCFFINMWSLGLSLITEFIHQFMPGRSGIKFYICTGRFDNSLTTEKVKVNYVLICYLTLAVIWYFFAAFKISKYRKYIKSITTVSILIQDSKTKLALLLKDTFHASMVNLVIIASTFLIIWLNIIIRTYFSTIAPASFNESVHFQLYHFLDHGSIVLTNVCVVVIYYSRNSVMRQTILREIKDDFLQLRERLSL
jgi:hypothetical protein